MKALLHQAGFILAGGAAGFASGILMPGASGVRGAILGACISAGAAVLNPWKGRGTMPGIVRVLVVAALAGAMAAEGVLAWECVRPYEWGRMEPFGHHLFDPLPWQAISGSLFYSIVLLFWIQARRADAPRSWVWLAAAIVFGPVARLMGAGGPVGVDAEILLGLALFSALTAVPFVGFWFYAAQVADPAWTRERWFLRTQGRVPPPPLPPST